MFGDVKLGEADYAVVWETLLFMSKTAETPYRWGPKNPRLCSMETHGSEKN